MRIIFKRSLAAGLSILAMTIASAGGLPTVDNFDAWRNLVYKQTGVNAPVKRCYAKLHACFRSTDLNDVFATVPFDENQCAIACQQMANYPDGTNACSLDECVSRCSVAFQIIPPSCN